MRKLRVGALACALGAIGSIVPFVARADGSCSTTVVIFSYPTGINSNAVRCLVDPAGKAGDGRIINPGSDSIAVRYTMDLQLPELTARLDGLGFEADLVTLTRGEAVAGTGLYVYDSPVIALADGPLSSGCLTATILDPEGGEEPLDSNSFHTVDSSCP